MTHMIEVEVAELSDWALNYAVARAVGYHVILEEDPCGPDYYLVMGREDMYLTRDPAEFYVWSPSTDWSQGGPLLARYFGLIAGMVPSLDMWPDNPDELLPWAMRKIVEIERGETFSVPAELMEMKNICRVGLWRTWMRSSSTCESAGTAAIGSGRVKPNASNHNIADYLIKGE